MNAAADPEEKRKDDSDDGNASAEIEVGTEDVLLQLFGC
jgi:hypothetical protein